MGGPTKIEHGKSGALPPSDVPAQYQVIVPRTATTGSRTLEIGIQGMRVFFVEHLKSRCIVIPERGLDFDFEPTEFFCEHCESRGWVELVCDSKVERVLLDAKVRERLAQIKEGTFTPATLRLRRTP